MKKKQKKSTQQNFRWAFLQDGMLYGLLRNGTFVVSKIKPFKRGN